MAPNTSQAMLKAEAEWKEAAAVAIELARLEKDTVEFKPDLSTSPPRKIRRESSDGDPSEEEQTQAY